MKIDPNKVATAPFDLGKALAGHPLVTRGGKRIGPVMLRDGMQSLIVKIPQRDKLLSGFDKFQLYHRNGCAKGTEGPDDILLDLTTPWRAKFDLQKALDGHPLVTRKGEVVTLIAYTPGSRACSTASIGGRVRNFTPRGRAKTQGKSSDDLFLDLRAKWEQDHQDTAQDDYAVIHRRPIGEPESCIAITKTTGDYDSLKEFMKKIAAARPTVEKADKVLAAVHNKLNFSEGMQAKSASTTNSEPFPAKLRLGWHIDKRHIAIDCVYPEPHLRIASVLVRMEGASEDDPNLLRFAEALVARFNALAGIAKVVQPRDQGD